MDRAPDYYVIIQVDPRAEREVIDAAFRRLAAKYHPDVNPSPEATERMKQINAAYEVLSDPDKRRAYDLRRSGFPFAPRGPRPEGSPRRGTSDWPMTAFLTIIMLVVTAGGARFGPRVLVLVALLFVLGWLIMAWRKS